MHLAIVTDLNRCMGCLACTVACKMENNVPIGSYRNKITRVGPFGKYPTQEMYFLPMMCQHCKDPLCVKICPSGALHRQLGGPCRGTRGVAGRFDRRRRRREETGGSATRSRRVSATCDCRMRRRTKRC